MRVSCRERLSQIRIRLRPVKLPAYWAFGVLFIAAGLLVTLTGARQTSLICTIEPSASAQCELRMRHLLRELRAHGNLDEARTVDRVTWGFMATRDVLVSIGGREHALILVGANGDEKDELVAGLNALARGSGPAVNYREDMRALFWAFGMLVIGAGTLILLSVEFISIIVDRDKRRLTILGRAWGRGRRDEIPLDRIAGIDATPFTVGRQTSWNVVLKLGGGRCIAVARTPLFTGASAAETIALLETARRRFAKTD